MKAYIIKKILLLIPILIAVSAIVFLMRALIPGDPVEAMYEGQIPDEKTAEILREKHGLNDPLPVQYFNYMKGVVKGDLGTSIRTGRPVLEEIGERFPNTIKLALLSLAFAVFFGGALGILSAIKKDTLVDVFSTIVALIGVSMPSFWLGLLLMYLFAVNLKILPVIGTDSFQHIILPALTLGLISTGIITRMVRSSLLEVLNQEYIRTARAKGLEERKVILKHALKNAMIPVVTIVGLQFGFLLGGAFIAENIFAWHGIGELAVQAIQNRDFPLIQGVILVTALTYVMVNLFIDILYSFLDVRISYD